MNNMNNNAYNVRSSNKYYIRTMINIMQGISEDFLPNRDNKRIYSYKYCDI